MPGETVLITGGTGFIGAFTAASVVEAGHEAVAFDLDDDERILAELGVADEVEVIAGDVTEPTELFRAVESTGATRIVHLAALLTHGARANPRRSLDVNVGGTNTVFEAARAFDRVQRVAWASSSAVYAPPAAYERRGIEEVDEDDLVDPATLYGAGKEYNEHQAEVYREDHGLSLVGLRPTLVYGPYRETGRAAAFTNFIEKPALGEPVSLGPAGALLDWHHVEDAARAFRLAALAPEADLSRPVYNVCGDRATLGGVADVLRDLLPDAEITVTDEGENLWTHFMNMDAARADLGYEPEYDLRSGIRHHVNVVREEHGLEPV